MIYKGEVCRPVSLADYLRCVRRFFNWCIAEGFTETNPTHNIKLPKDTDKVIRPFTSDEINRLLSLCDAGTFLGSRNKAIILMFLDTGIRLNELVKLKCADVDLDHEVVKVLGKGNKERICRIGRLTQKALMQYALKRSDNYKELWVSEERKPLTEWGVKLAIKALGKRAGLSEVRCSPHTFRHTFATYWLRNGGGEFMLQAALGHTTLTMTRRYTKMINSEEAVKAHKKFGPVDNLLR